MNKNNRSLRKVAGLTGVSYVTVRNVLKGSGAKAYHKYRVQKMTDDKKNGFFFHPLYHTDSVFFWNIIEFEQWPWCKDLSL